MHKVVSVRAMAGYRVRVRFSDGMAGEVDLSDLVGKGVFRGWTDHEEFQKVSIDPETHTLAWPGGVDVCPDSLYEEIAAQKAA